MCGSSLRLLKWVVDKNSNSSSSGGGESSHLMSVTGVGPCFFFKPLAGALVFKSLDGVVKKLEVDEVFE
jgi:hypothetical protein